MINHYVRVRRLKHIDLKKRAPLNLSVKVRKNLGNRVLSWFDMNTCQDHDIETVLCPHNLLHRVTRNSLADFEPVQIDSRKIYVKATHLLLKMMNNNFLPGEV